MTELTLLSGKVSNLKTKKGYKSFISSNAGRAATKAGAVGAAASGALFNSGILTTAAMMREGVTYYTCKVNGVTITGYLNTVAFKNTDEVEFVVEYNPRDKTQALAYAVRKPKERKLWIMDRMESGENIMKEASWRLPMIFMVVMMPVILLFRVTVTCFNDCRLMLTADYLLINFFVALGGGYVLIYFLLVIGLHISYLPKARIANKIIAALGYDDPKEVSLAAVSQEAKKQWEEENGKPFPKSDDLFVFHY